MIEGDAAFEFNKAYKKLNLNKGLERCKFCGWGLRCDSDTSTVKCNECETEFTHVVFCSQCGVSGFSNCCEMHALEEQEKKALTFKKYGRSRDLPRRDRRSSHE